MSDQVPHNIEVNHEPEPVLAMAGKECSKSTDKKNGGWEGQEGTEPEFKLYANPTPALPSSPSPPRSPEAPASEPQVGPHVMQ